MHDFVQALSHWAAAILETIGIAMLLLSAVYALGFAGVRLAKRSDSSTTYHRTRRALGRGILLGLEFLVAADIIMTVAVELTFARVGVLAIVVLIRTFLSFTLEVEMTGNWPWQNKNSNEEPAASD